MFYVHTKCPSLQVFYKSYSWKEDAAHLSLDVTFQVALTVRGSKKKAKAFLDELLTVYNKKHQATLKAISKMKYPEKFLQEQSRIMALPLFSFVEEWTDHSSHTLQPTTVDGYKALCNGRLREYFEPQGTTVYDLTGDDLNGFYAYLTKCGLKGSTQ